MTSAAADGVDAFDAYEARVLHYGRTWFRQDAAAAAVLEHVAAVRAQANRLAAGLQTVGTEVVYRAGNRWVDDRGCLQAQVVQDALRIGGFDPDGDGFDRVPQAVLLLGLPGSGKSTMLRPVAAELIRRTSNTSEVIVDADIVRTLLPEYAGGLGSEVVQPETSYVANTLLLDEAYRRRVNLVLDKVGDPEWTVEQVQYLVRAGWSVWCLCAKVDVDIAVERAERRALTSGRYVPIDFIRSRTDRPVLAYEAVRTGGLNISGCALLSTDVPIGHRPIVLDALSEELFGPPGAKVTLWPGSRSEVSDLGGTKRDAGP